MGERNDARSPAPAGLSAAMRGALTGITAQQKELGVRQLLSQDHYLGQVIERLDRVSRAMNPLLLFVAVSLMVLSLACVVNLIDWSDSAQPPADTVAGDPPASRSNVTEIAPAPKAAPVVSLPAPPLSLAK